MPHSLAGWFSSVATAVYRNFIAYFLAGEVGWRWALFNNCAALLVIYVMSYVVMPQKSRKANRELLRTKRQQRELHFQKIGEELASANEPQKEKRQRISALSFTELKEQLQNGHITATDAVDAFRWKSFECQQKYNCIVEFIQGAMEMAQDLDREYSDGRKKKPPLFGMPFSVKENFYLKGYELTLGFAKFLGEPMKEDNSLVAHIRSLGAIPIVRTNVPQTCISFTCSNSLYGTTANPHDSTRTPGGSSGGEGCLVAAGGVPFGTGSDVGGSVRIPAHFCGITTIKPTSNRPKVTGGHPGIPGVTKLALSYSFFTKDVASLAHLFELMLVPDYFARIPQCVPLPFNTELVTRKRAPLRIGYYVEDGWFPSVPACKRAVMEAKEILASFGHELVPFIIPSPERAAVLIIKSLFPDNGAYFVKQFLNDEVDPNLQGSNNLSSIPLSIRWLAAKVLAPFFPKTSLALNAYVRDLEDLRAIYEDVDAYVKEFTDHWLSLKLDAVLGIVLPFPALPHNGPSMFSHGAFSTLLYNLLDYPAGVIRVTKVTKADEIEMTNNYPTPDTATRYFQHPVNKQLRKALEKSEGLPVGVQVITLPYQEELCMKVLRDIELGLEKVVV